MIKQVNRCECISYAYYDKFFRRDWIYILKLYLASIKKEVTSCTRVPLDIKNKIEVHFDNMKSILKKKRRILDVDITVDDVAKLWSEDNVVKEKIAVKNIQPSLKKFWIKKYVIARAHMEITKFFYNICIPIYCCKCSYFLSMLIAISKLGDAFKTPSYHELSVTLLRKVKQELQI